MPSVNLRGEWRLGFVSFVILVGVVDVVEWRWLGGTFGLPPLPCLPMNQLAKTSILRLFELNQSRHARLALGY